MKMPKWFLCSVLLAAAPWLVAAANDPADIPLPVPSDVQLKNGVVLHKVTVLRWERDRVVLKHSGGADPIMYANIADSQKELIMARGRYEVSHPSAPPAAVPVVEKDGGNKIVYQGQVAVPTMDLIAKVGGIYKFSGTMVYAFPVSALGAFATNDDVVKLPKPAASAKTDADGNFTLSVPADIPCFIYCQGARDVAGGHQDYAWCVESKDIKEPTAISLGVKFRVAFRHLHILE